MTITARNVESTTTRRQRRIRTAAVFLSAILLVPFAASVHADSSPTGRTPKLFWTSARQAVWNQMRSQNHPWWRQIKSNADLSGTSNSRYADLGQWATMAYQVTGDPVYAQKAWDEANSRLKGATAPNSSRNFTREHFIEYAWMYDWLFPALTAAQRQQWIDSLNYWADLCLSQTSVSWGTRLSDSDETTGHYFGIVLWDLASAGDNPRAGTFIPHSKVGGLDQTGASRNNMRNAVSDYIKRAVGGVWLEGTEYNLGTLQLLLMGADGVATATGSEKFPEMGVFRKEIVLAQLQELTPDLKRAFQWGDTEEPRGIKRDRRLGLLNILAGLLQDDSTIGPSMRHAANLLQSTAEPGFRWMIFGNPYAAATDFRTALAKGHVADGMGVLLAHDGWGSNQSLFASHMAPRSTVDHESHYFSNVELYRAGEYILTHVIGYDANEAEHHNSILIGGLSMMDEARGAFGGEVGPGYAYHVGATGGNRYKNGYYNPPPRFVHEWTRSLLYLPSTDQRHDTIVVFDRVNALDPETLPKLTRYTSADQSRITGSPALKQWILHTPVSPTLDPLAITWQTAGGQTVKVSTLLPANQNRTIYDETLTGLKGTIISSEKKFQVRITPETDQRWDAFLNVIQASDGTTSLTNTLVSSTNNGAKGVLIKRPGHTDVLAIFNATQGPDLPSSKVVNGYLQTDSTLLNRLDANRLHATGFTVSWVAGTATTVYLADLDPAVQWMVAVDGASESPLAVSDESMAIATVSGSGSHTLQVRPAGAAIDATAPAITNIQVSSITISGALVTWTTDEAATEQVEFGTTGTYGQVIPLASSLSTSHQVLLGGLSGDTIYHYRVISADASGNQALSSDAAFQTAAGATTPSPTPVNHAPVLDPVADKTALEGQVLAVALTGSDADGDALAYTAQALPAGAALTGSLLTWMPTFEQAGTYPVTFAVSDGALSDSETITITVVNTNRPPVLSSVGAQQVAEGATLAVGLSASDPDGDALTYRAVSTLPSGAALNGALLSWTPTYQQAGQYDVTVEVSDGELSDAETFTVTVANTNADPVVNAGADVAVQLASPVTITLSGLASDDGLPDNTLTAQWSSVSGPGAVMFGNAAQAQTTATFTVEGGYVLRLTVSDGEATVSDDVAVTVLPEPEPAPTGPMITGATVASGRSVAVGTLAVGAKLYMDRSYTVASFPPALAGHEYIRMRNEDKYRKDSTYLTFTLTQPATVYVAFSPAADTLPSWLKNSAWVRTGETLSVAGDGTRLLYRREYPAGTVNLGGNGALWKIDPYSQYSVIAVPN